MPSPIFAHGPWWSEWHHLLPYLSLAVPTAAGIGVWFRNIRKK